MSTPNKSMRDCDQDIVITGIGMITAYGYGIEANLNALKGVNERKSMEDYKVKGFNPAPYLTDRKVVKVVSQRDVLGLVAFEECVRNAAIRHEKMNPDRTGLYVGAPPSATTDNANYSESIELARDTSGSLIEAEFGNTFKSASPTTLLSGLPNNVLCYGSKTLDARGPNSNYTMLETSGLLSIIGASRAMRLGRLDCAIAGGFSAHTDPVILASIRRQGLLKAETSGSPYAIEIGKESGSSGTITADGAAFVSLELRSAAEARGAKIFGTLRAVGTASESLWPDETAKNNTVLMNLMNDLLKKAGISSSEVGIIAISGSGIQKIDDVELKAIEATFGKNEQSNYPLVIATSRIWGNLMEAGGVADISAMDQIFLEGSVPSELKVKTSFVQAETRITSRVGMVLRQSSWGEYTGLIVSY